MRLITSGKHDSLLVLVAGFLGLSAAVAIGILRIVNTIPPLRVEEAFGNTVFTLILITPYAATLWSIRLSVRSRWVILLPSALLSLASLSISPTGAGIVFLPSTVLLIVAAARLMRKEPLLRLRRGLLLASLVMTAVVVMAFALLFSQQDPRTWQVVNYTDDGTQYIVWNPVTQADPTMHPWTPNAILAGGGTISDVISNVEAAESLGLMVVGIGFTMLSFIRLEGTPMNPRSFSKPSGQSN